MRLTNLLERLKTAGVSADPSQFDTMLEIMDHMADEIQVALPDVRLLMELNSELLRIHAARMAKAAADIATSGNTDEFGVDPAAQTLEFEARANRINSLAARKVAQINALTALVNTLNSSQGAAQPPHRPVDSGSGRGDDEDMLKRIEKLEADVSSIKIDVGVVKANGAAKSDLADLRGSLAKDFTELKGAFAESKASTKADISEAKTQIVIWVVGAVILTQLLPAIAKAIPSLAKFFQ